MPRFAIVLGALVAGCGCGFALDPSLDISQYAHTAWTVRGGYSAGTIFAMAQTPDGYLWLASEFGLFRFDGVRFIAWEPPTGQHLSSKPYSLLVTHDGVLWIGTYAGLVSWNGGKLTGYPEIGESFVTSLLEDREGTVWAGTLEQQGRLCAIRSGRAQCYGQDGAFGGFVWSLGEDRSGTLWAGADSGLWQWKPGPPKRYAMGKRIGDLSNTEDGRLLIGMRGAGLKQLVGKNVEAYAIRSATNPNELLPDREVNSNKLLRDRDGGLWIGTDQRGLIHMHHGRTDVFRRSDGLSGDIIAGLFEDREGNIWVSTAGGGFDRFRELPVTTVSVQQGLPSSAATSVLAATNGNIWVATGSGLTRRNNEQITIFDRASGLPDDFVQSLFEDNRGRIWVFAHGLAYFNGQRFVPVKGVPSDEVYSIIGDNAGNLWLSGNRGLSHLHEGQLVENLPWSALGRRQQAKVILYDQGGLWLAFWQDGGVLHFKDGHVLASYTAAEGLGKGPVAGLRLDRDKAVWAATQLGGASRIKDGHIATLTTSNGLPCDTIHWTTEDDNGSLWLYTACGLVRIARNELDGWINDPKRRIETTVWDASDGVMPLGAPSSFGPTFARSTDGKLWFLPGQDVAVVDPRHIAFNKVPPPVHIESVKADGKKYVVKPDMRLPANVRDVWIDYTALSLVAPEKVRFRYKLEGQDHDWIEVVNDRQAQYTNLPPRNYRFRVMASNNSGVWNETGDSLDFSIAPAYYQTRWFLALCVTASLALLWAAYQVRARQLQEQEAKFREAVETMPALAFVALPDGYRTFVNRGWVEYTGLTVEQASGYGWHVAAHPDDLERIMAAWRRSAATGEPLEYEARLRGAGGEYRWFQMRAAPLRDKRGRIVKWCGVATDIEDRKRAEQEREKLRELEADLAHINRVSVLGELAASIAHEVNQPLSGIVSNGSACLRWLAADTPNMEEVHEAIRDMVRDGKRAGEVIARIRALTRKAAAASEKLDLNETIREVLALLGDEAKRSRVMIRTDFADDIFPVLGDRVQLQQVMLNLAMNAIEAMSGVDDRARRLVISTRNLDSDQVQVTVEDSGIGITPDTLQRIFDAFYTTKPNGMGMGLSISRSIIENHGGRLWSTGNDGPGTTFQFTLPKNHAGASDARVAGV